jgi:hypothetical protein
MMTRTLYRWLVCLHPPAFRLRFEQELLWIFDESSDASGAVPLLYDAAISLLRQWLIRSGMWKWVVGGYRRSGAAPHRVRKLFIRLAYAPVTQNGLGMNM